MATKKFSIGMFFKKLINNQGDITGYQPMLIKTLAKLVYTNNGTTVEKAISDLDDSISVTNDNIKTLSKKRMEFASLAAYKAEVAKGTNLTGVLCIINDGPTVK